MLPIGYRQSVNALYVRAGQGKRLLRMEFDQDLHHYPSGKFLRDRGQHCGARSRETRAAEKPKGQRAANSATRRQVTASDQGNSRYL
jgi:hypothetical protein